MALLPYEDWAWVDTEAGHVYRKRPSGELYRAPGTVDAHGYLVLNRLKKLHKVHRMVATVLGILRPGADIDHINGDKQDNRGSNLRAACRSGNSANQHKPRPKRYSQVKGVSYDKAREQFIGHVTWQGTTHSRRFATEQEAVEFVTATRKEVHGEYATA